VSSVIGAQKSGYIIRESVHIRESETGGAQKSGYIIRESVHIRESETAERGCTEIGVYYKGECAHGESETAESGCTEIE
jgi:hypothetical protein